MPEPYTITAFYKFLPLEESTLADQRSALQRVGFTFRLFGLTLISTEGINGTVSGSAEGIENFKNYLER